MTQQLVHQQGPEPLALPCVRDGHGKFARVRLLTGWRVACLANYHLDALLIDDCSEGDPRTVIDFDEAGEQRRIQFVQSGLEPLLARGR